MTTHFPMTRVPFAPLDNSRLQHLASAKNRQNGLAAQHTTSTAKSNISMPKNVLSSVKRSFEPSMFDDVDGENIDPATFCSPSKKSKSDVSEKPFKPFTFSLSPSKTMPPPSTIPSHFTTPARANMSSPRATLTAPAGRSPKRKASGIQKSRRISAPFSRVDPPFSTASTGLPFSLDAALSGTFSKSKSSGASATIQESMPKNWFFDIYEDTPEEQAANLMEHSTLTLDLSSDDENRKSLNDRGKENMPPEDYDAPTASRPAEDSTLVVPSQRVKKTDIIRRKVDKMDDGEREPLCDLETDDFIPEGLVKDSHVVINPSPVKTENTSTKLAINGLFATPVAFSAGSTNKASKKISSSLFDMPVVSAVGDVKGDIIVWEDSPSSAQSSSPNVKTRFDEENTENTLADMEKQM